MLPQNVENQHPPDQVLQKGKPSKGETNITCRFRISENSGLLSSVLFTSLIPCWLPRRLTAGILNISMVHFRRTNPAKLALELLVSTLFHAQALSAVAGSLC